MPPKNSTRQSVATLRPDQFSNIIEAVKSPRGFQKHFSEDTWSTWWALLKAIYGLSLDEDELVTFQTYTGRTAPRAGGYDEAMVIAGRRAGKSRIAALICAYEALFGGWAEKVASGERFWSLVVATDRQQANIIIGYAKALLDRWRGLIERESVEELHLTNGASIGVRAAKYTGTRGYSTCVAIMDELAFFRSVGAQPAEEIMAALIPSLLPGAKLIGISTPYSRSGLLHTLWRDHYGKDSDILIWKAPTVAMNPSYRQSTIDKLLHRDKALYSAEYLAEWREDIAAFLDDNLIEMYATGLPQAPTAGRKYRASVDPSGGRADSMTLAIGHLEGEKIILDITRERAAPFVPTEVVAEFAAVMRSYGIRQVHVDRYSGNWVEEAFNKQGIITLLTDLSASDLYLEFAARMASGQVRLLDDAVLKDQLRSLERFSGQSGRDKVDHPAGTHDDLANAVASVVVALGRDLAQSWTPEQVEARLPSVSPHRAAPFMSPELKDEQDKARVQLSNEEIMDEFMQEPGAGRFVK